MTLPNFARIPFLLLAVLWLLPAAPARALDPWKPLPTCTFAMPLMGEAVKKDQHGMIIAVFKAVYEPAGIRFRHQNMPYDQAVAAAEQGKVHCTLDVKERKGKLVRGDHPLFFYDLASARLKTTEWKGLDSLKGKRVAYLHGLGLETFLPVKFVPHHIFDLASAFHLLDQGIVQYAMDDSRLLRYAQRDSKLPSHFFLIDPIRSFEIYPVFAPTEEGNRYREIYNRRMKEITASGDLASVLTRNGLSDERIERILKAQ